MNGHEVEWLRAHAAKMDRNLRGAVVDSLRLSPRVPCFVSRLLLPFRRRRRVPVVVQFQKECSKEEFETFTRRLAELRCGKTCELPAVGGIATEIPIGRLKEVVEDARVKRVTLDREVKALMDVAAPSVYAPAVWDELVTGAGVGVAVIDTGIHPHDDFTKPINRIVGFCDFVRNRNEPYDDNGHGTHVAGIAAGNGYRSNGRYRGIAPGARLIGVKVLDAQGSGRLSTVIQGIQWCIERRAQLGIRVINLSLGAPAVDSYRDDPLAMAVEAAWENGIVVCAAAGNEGPGARTIATPGIHPRVITVGASDDQGTARRGDDTVALFSGRGPTIDDIQKPDLVAPGVGITAPNSPRSTIAVQNRRKSADYVSLSGTSMATPVCSGIVALTLEKNPGLSPDEVKRRLLDSAATLGLDRNTEGRGLVDARKAALGRVARFGDPDEEDKDPGVDPGGNPDGHSPVGPDESTRRDRSDGRREDPDEGPHGGPSEDADGPSSAP